MLNLTKVGYKKENKICQNCRKDFVTEPDDFGFYEKISAQGAAPAKFGGQRSASGGNVPPPTFCPECRLQRRFMVRNERNFYKRECDLCKKRIISMYSLEKSFPVHCKECWWGDDWDPMDYGVDYDFSKTFFVQFRNLLDKVSRPNLLNSNTKNSDYCNYSELRNSATSLFHRHAKQPKNCLELRTKV